MSRKTVSNAITTALLVLLTSACTNTNTIINTNTNPKSSSINPATGISSEMFSPAVPMPAASLDTTTSITRVALGSCFHPRRDAGIFDEIAAANPDVMVMLGDNVYAEDEADDPELKSLRQAYAELASVESFSRLRQSTPLLVAWDDHDYGKNDAGAEFVHKQAAQSLYQHVWAVTADDPRTSRNGIYYEKTTGPQGQRVQFILLDTRFFRSPMTLNPDQQQGRYTASDDPDQSMLGETQWRWLETQLNKPADVRVVVTPVQMIADGHYWEAWAMMPRERQRFYRLLEKTSANGVVMVSGDRHSAALYRLAGETPYPLFEMTTSSLNIPLTAFVKDPVDEPGPYRLTPPFYESNYGLIDIDWADRTVTLQIMGANGTTVANQEVALQNLTSNAKD